VVLYIVATPIGNLKDISKRAFETLKKVDLILCEDTRQTQKLLNFYRIKKKTLSYHQHSKLKKIKYISDILKKGKDIALVSDAGTPGISDPGGKLIEFLIKEIPELKISPIPGPSAILAAASISGFPMDKFLFLGFPPVKKKRKKFFEQVLKSKYPVMFFESCYRIIKSLNELELEAKILKLNPELVVCQELTKKFETIFRGNISQVLEKLKNHPIKGEFVIVIRNF